MKSKLPFLLLAVVQTLAAQTFTELTPALVFNDMEVDAIAHADVDGDNDPDVLFSGGSFIEPILKLYINNGSGHFTEMPDTPFEGLMYSTVNFSDIDGDNDQDVLITGLDSLYNNKAELFLNDGLGHFTKITDTPFEEVYNSMIEFSDVDGDNDQDVLIIGSLTQYDRIAKLYINDGLGHFTEMVGTPFESPVYGTIDFSDVDGDNDQDVLITGDHITSSSRITKLYLNDGMGHFTEMTDIPFEGFSPRSVVFVDVDGDNDQDVLIAGFDNSYALVCKIYTNDGSGHFTEMQGSLSAPYNVRRAASADLDGDNDQDLLITGLSGEVPIARLFINDGSGHFTEMPGNMFNDIDARFISFADFDGDNDPDLLVSGWNTNYYIPIGTYSKLYLRDGVGVSSTEEKSLAENLQFILFPNPSTSPTLFLSYDSAEMSEVTISVYGINGVLLNQQKEMATIGQQVFPVDIESLPKGNYFIELDNGKGRGAIKFVVP
jgi:hypothetical protein